MNYLYKIFLYSSFILIPLLMDPSYAYAQLEGMFGTHNELLGKTGVAHDQSRITSLPYNPAHISNIKNPGINMASGLSYYMYTYRFIGDISRSSSKLGLSGIPLPLIVYPVSKGLIFGGFIIPIPVGTKIQAKKIPLGLLGQLNLADLSGEAKLRMYIDLYSNIFKNSFLSIGTNINYSSFDADVGVNANGYTGDHIVDVHLENSTFSFKLGMKIKVNSRLYLGLSSILFYTNTTSTSITTIVDADDDGDGNPDPKDPTVSKSSLPVKNIRFGLTFKILPRLMLYSDLEYSRVQVTEELSLVDFVEKEKDVSDTLSFYLGSEFILSPRYQILAGAFYEPASVGSGSKGKDGKVGFGFMDLAMNLGSPPSKPAWGLATGLRSGFIKMKKKRKRTTVFERYKPSHALNIDVGVVFAKTSIGIPETGEQPASYDVTRLSFPVEISYTF